MAMATNTTPGSIVLGGDLTGVAYAPTLRPTGVIPGTYSPANLVSDSKGRLVYVKQVSSAEIMDMLPSGSATTPGPIQVCDQLKMVDGAMTLDMRDATVDLPGKVQIGAGLEVEDGEVKLPYATVYSKGIMQAGEGLDVNAGVLTIGEIQVGEKGMVQIGDNIDVSGGIISYASPDATSTTLGLVSVGTGLDITAGVLSLAAPTATTGVKGMVQVGTNITLTGSTISIPTATELVKGVISPGAGIGVLAGALSIADATYTSKGLSQVGPGLVVTAGVLSQAIASKTVKGVAQVGGNIDVTAGTISVKTATTSQQGVVQVGSNIDVSAGTISIKTASATQKGLATTPSNNNFASIYMGANSSLNIGWSALYTGLNNIGQTPYTTLVQGHTISARSGPTITWDGLSKNIFSITAAAGAVLTNGVNLQAGAYYHFVVTGNATLTYGTQFKFKPGAISQPSGTTSLLSCYVIDSNTLYCIMQPNFA